MSFPSLPGTRLQDADVATVVAQWTKPPRTGRSVKDYTGTATPNISTICVKALLDLNQTTARAVVSAPAMIDPSKRA